MTTTVVRKGAGRPAAAKRTAKAAQRTPFPPKPAVTIPVTCVNDERGTIHVHRTGCADLKRGRIKTCKARWELAPICQRDVVEDVYGPQAGDFEGWSLDAWRDFAGDLEFYPCVDDLPEEPARAAAKPIKVAKGKPAKLNKAEKDRAHFESNGWTVEVTVDGNGKRVEMTAARGQETIHQVWDGLNYVYDDTVPTYSLGDQTVKPRNAAAARWYAARTEAEAATRFRKVATNRMFRPAIVALAPAAGLPFELDAPDATIIHALLGRQVAWHNRYRQVEEVAIFGSDPRKVEIKMSPTDERIVQFCCPETGFRAFRLADLRAVGSIVPVSSTARKTRIRTARAKAA